MTSLLQTSPVLMSAAAPSTKTGCASPVFSSLLDDTSVDQHRENVVRDDQLWQKWCLPPEQRIPSRDVATHPRQILWGRDPLIELLSNAKPRGGRAVVAIFQVCELRRHLARIHFLRYRSCLSGTGTRACIADHDIISSVQHEPAHPAHV